MNKVLIVFTGLFLFVTCNEESEVDQQEEIEVSATEQEQDDLIVEAIIDSVYQKNGSSKIDKSNIYFSFREFQYAYEQDQLGLKRSLKVD